MRGDEGGAFLELMGDFLSMTGLDGGTTIPGHGEVVVGGCVVVCTFNKKCFFNAYLYFTSKSHVDVTR
jgi:hypothetical protein